jgi:hypothetical protein
MRDIILDKLREMMKPAKVKKTKPFTPSKKDIEAHGNEIQRREDAREPSDRDAEIDQMAKDYGYGKKEEAIDFSKKTVLGKAARPMAAQMLRHHKKRLQQPGSSVREPEKGGQVAKALKQFSRENYKQRESLALILANKIEESTNLKDRMVEALAQKLTESPMEFTYRTETPEEKAKNKARVEQLRREARAKKKPSGGSKPEADGGEGTKPGSYFTNRHGGRTEN